MSKVETTAAVIMAVIAVLSFPLLQNAFTNIPTETWEKTGYLIVIGAISTLVYGFFIFTIMSFAKDMIRRYTIKTIRGRGSAQTIAPGETLYLEVDLEARFTLWNAFFEIVVTNPYGESTTSTAYARQTGSEFKGLLRGKEKDTFKLRWTAPNDAVPGEYIAAIYTCDIRQNDFFKKQKYTLKKGITKFNIAAHPIKKVEILKATKVNGGICIRVDNPTQNNYADSNGRLIVGKKMLPLYDYREYLKNMNGHAKNLDLYSVFDITNNSSKLLYVSTTIDTKTVKVLLDVGKHTIEKELSIG